MRSDSALVALRGLAPEGSRLGVGRWVVAATLFVAISGCSAGASGTASSSSTVTGTVTAASTQPSATVSAGPLLPGLIVFRRDSDATGATGALFTIASDGSGERQLTRPPASTLDDEPGWSPDGTRVVFTRSPQTGQQQLFTISSDGSGLKAVSPAGSTRSDGIQAGDNAGVFSPDGTRIAFGTYRGHVVNGEIEFSSIGVMDVNGSHRRQVTVSAAYSGDDGGVAWSPDGKHLVYARSNAGTTAPVGGRALFVIDVDGSHRRQLTPWSLGAGGTPDWSAATNLIVFRAVDNEEAGKGNFYTIHPDGTGLTQVTHFTDTVISHKVGFSPDGKWIVFAKDGMGGANDVFIAHTDGSDMSSVTNTSQADSAPDWAPR